MRRSNQVPTLLNARGRFVRLEDNAQFMGWVVGERDLQFVVAFEDSRIITAGESFLCELALRDWTYKIVAAATKVTTKSGDGEKGLVVTTMSQVRTVNIEHSSGNERFRVPGVIADVYLREDRATSCEVLDVSDSGLSIVVPEELPLGTRMLVSILCSGERLAFACEVRYCQAAKEGYRLGMLIHHRDRVYHRKWQRFISERHSLGSAMAA